MNLSSVDNTIWALSTVGQLLLFVLLLRRRLSQDFPIFLLYLLYSSFSDIAFFAYSHVASPRSYLLAFFFNNVVEFLLQAGILMELGMNVLKPVRRSLPKASIYIFMGMLAVSTIVALSLSIHSQPAYVDRWSQYLLHVNFGAAIFRMAVFATIAVFSQMLGIGWKNHVFQIATGFLAYSIVILMVELGHRWVGVKDDYQYHLLEQFRVVSWCLSLGYWSYALVKREAPRKEFTPRMANFLMMLAETPNHNGTISAPPYRK